MFAENETSPGTKFTIWNGSGSQVVKTFYINIDTRKVNLPLYSYKFNFEGNYSGSTILTENPLHSAGA
jgi:hypothetical protein